MMAVAAVEDGVQLALVPGFRGDLQRELIGTGGVVGRLVLPCVTFEHVVAKARHNQQVEIELVAECEAGRPKPAARPLRQEQPQARGQTQIAVGALKSKPAAVHENLGPAQERRTFGVLDGPLEIGGLGVFAFLQRRRLDPLENRLHLRNRARRKRLFRDHQRRQLGRLPCRFDLLRKQERIADPIVVNAAFDDQKMEAAEPTWSLLTRTIATCFFVSGLPNTAGGQRRPRRSPKPRTSCSASGSQASTKPGERARRRGASPSGR